MRSKTTDQFWKLYNILPEHIKKEARKSYKIFINNPHYSSLHFKRIHPRRPIYSIRITIDYRAIGIQKEKEIIWFWIGTHSAYDKLVQELKA